jgi:hypothetical protein
VFYRRIWNIVGKYSILCCDTFSSKNVLYDIPAVEGMNRGAIGKIVSYAKNLFPEIRGKAGAKNKTASSF